MNADLAGLSVLWAYPQHSQVRFQKLLSEYYLFRWLEEEQHISDDEVLPNQEHWLDPMYTLDYRHSKILKRIILDKWHLPSL